MSFWRSGDWLLLQKTYFSRQAGSQTGSTGDIYAKVWLPKYWGLNSACIITSKTFHQAKCMHCIGNRAPFWTQPEYRTGWWVTDRQQYCSKYPGSVSSIPHHFQISLLQWGTKALLWSTRGHVTHCINCRSKKILIFWGGSSVFLTTEAQYVKPSLDGASLISLAEDLKLSPLILAILECGSYLSLLGSYWPYTALLSVTVMSAY
jgi:hypothetical protein